MASRHSASTTRWAKSPVPPPFPEPSDLYAVTKCRAYPTKTVAVRVVCQPGTGLIYPARALRASLTHIRHVIQPAVGDGLDRPRCSFPRAGAYWWYL